MAYNWEEIFKNKTNKELYKIYVGQSHLTPEAQKFAKKELDARNFDFNNMQSNIDGWKLSSLVNDDFNEANGISGNQSIYIKPWLVVVIIIVGTGLMAFLISQDSGEFSMNHPAIYVTSIIILLVVLLNNFFAKKADHKREERKIEIEQLKAKLKEKGQLEDQSPIKSEIIRGVNKETEAYINYKKVSLIGFIIVIIITILTKLFL